jgi:hypothetical protein
MFGSPDRTVTNCGAPNTGNAAKDVVRILTKDAIRLPRDASHFIFGKMQGVAPVGFGALMQAADRFFTVSTS